MIIIYDNDNESFTETEKETATKFIIMVYVKRNM